MARAEIRESLAEKAADVPKLDDKLTETAKELQMNMVFWQRDLTPQLEVLVVMGVLQSEEHPLKPAEVRRLKRMIGLQLRTTPLVKIEPGDHRFWEIVNNEAGAEIDKARGFAPDLSDMPKSWQSANNSLVKLQQSLRAQRGE
jgi:hypothetical protein